MRFHSTPTVYVNPYTGKRFVMNGLTSKARALYKRCLKLFLENAEWMTFDDVAFAPGNTYPEIYKALKDMWLQLGIQQGKVQRKARRKSPEPGYIEIVRTPAGEAPLAIRTAWVGLVLLCDPFLGISDGDAERGVLTGKKLPERQIGFSVPQAKALAVLEMKNPKAAAWWKKHRFPQRGKCFGFDEAEAEIVSGVTHQRLIKVDDDMMGDPCR